MTRDKSLKRRIVTHILAKPSNVLELLVSITGHIYPEGMFLKVGYSDLWLLWNAAFTTLQIILGINNIRSVVIEFFGINDQEIPSLILIIAGNPAKDCYPHLNDVHRSLHLGNTHAHSRNWSNRYTC